MRGFRVRNAVAGRLMRPLMAQVLPLLPLPSAQEEPKTPPCLQYTSVGAAPAHHAPQRVTVEAAPPPDGSARPPRGFMIPEAPFVVDYGSDRLGEGDRRRAGQFASVADARRFACSDARIEHPGEDGWYRVIDCLNRTVELACSECALDGR